MIAPSTGTGIRGFRWAESKHVGRWFFHGTAGTQIVPEACTRSAVCPHVNGAPAILHGKSVRSNSPLRRAAWHGDRGNSRRFREERSYTRRKRRATEAARESRG